MGLGEWPWKARVCHNPVPVGSKQKDLGEVIQTGSGAKEGAPEKMGNTGIWLQDARQKANGRQVENSLQKGS